MESGRSTPVAMKRPASRRTTLSVSCLHTDLATNVRPQGQRPVRPPLTTRPPFNPAQNDAPSAQHNCFIPYIVNNWIANLAAVQCCVLTAVGLSWAVYSRFLRVSLTTKTGRIDIKPSVLKEDSFSDFCIEGIVLPTPKPNRPRLSTLIKVDGHDEEENKDFERGRGSAIERDTPGQPNIHHEPPAKDSDITMKTQKLLQKHFNYLMPWVSTQPSSTNNEEEDTLSESDDFRTMSMPAFLDLSTAIYRDVRRRERASPSPTDGGSKPWDHCTTRNRQNESRMILCRTINEQFHRLVLALVLEQARRLAEVRIRLNRRAGMVERGCLSPMAL